MATNAANKMIYISERTYETILVCGIKGGKIKSWNALIEAFLYTVYSRGFHLCSCEQCVINYLFY